MTGWSKYEYNQRRFDISVSFRFGSLQTSVKRTDKSIENDDLMGGGKSGGGGGGSTYSTDSYQGGNGGDGYALACILLG